MASIPRQLPQQVSDLTSPLVGQRQGSRISRPWYDWALWVSQQITGLLDGDGVVIPPGTITFTQTDVVLGRKSPGAGVGEEITFTDQAQQLADDTSFAQMRATLGIDASTTPYTPSDVGYWGGSDPGEVDDALNYLALNGVHVPTTLAADEKFLVPIDRQCLYAATITVDGTLTVDGDLIEVQTEAVQVLGTANEITSTQSGYTYTISLPASLTFTGKTVTGGTFNSGAFNGTLGATTPNTVAATTITTTGSGTFGGTVVVGNGASAARSVIIDTAAGFNRSVQWRTAGVNRMAWVVNATAETGSDAGSDGRFFMYDDAGVANTVFSIPRVSTGAMQIQRTVLLEDGAVGSPGRSYRLDTDTGSYRIGANNEGFSAGGTLQFEYSANGFFTRRANHGAAVTLTANTTLDASHETVWVDATSGAITITVPAASGRQYRKYNIFKVDNSVNAVTINRSGSDNVMFATSVTLNLQGEGINVQSDGSTNWYPYA